MDGIDETVRPDELVHRSGRGPEFGVVVQELFWSAVSAADDEPGMAGPYLDGSRLAWAAADVLGAHGAGISVVADPHARLPLGASSELVATAERWQFTTGEGPCLDAHLYQDSVMATEAVTARTWPGFFQHLREHTPFRSVYAIPVRHVGALVLYHRAPAGCSTIDVGAAGAVARIIRIAATDGQRFPDGESWPGWYSPAARLRSRVWVAMGMVGVGLGLDQGDALAVLRAYAFGHDRTVDHVASDVVTGLLTPGHLRS